MLYGFISLSTLKTTKTCNYLDRFVKYYVILLCFVGNQVMGAKQEKKVKNWVSYLLHGHIQQEGTTYMV